VAFLGVAVEEHRADEAASETAGEVLLEVEADFRAVEDFRVVPTPLREGEVPAEGKDRRCDIWAQ